MMKLEGKVVLVTGSSQGIGQAIAIRLAQEGANVVINYRSHPEGSEETLSKVKAAWGKCHADREKSSTSVPCMKSCPFLTLRLIARAKVA